MTAATAAGPALRWDTPELSTRPMRTLLLYFEREYGRQRLVDAWRNEDMPLPLEFVENLNNFISYAFLERTFQLLVSASGDPDFIARAGRHIATPEALGFAFYLLRGVGSPLLAYRKTIELAPTYNRVGRFELLAETKSSLELKYTSSVVEPSPLACQGRKANFAAFPRIWGLPEATVDEVCCQVDGAPHCHYRIAWTNPPPLAWRRWAGLVVALGAGALTATWLASNPLAFAAALGLAGFGLGALLDARVQARQKDALLEQQTRGLTRSVEELQQRADEVFRANVELDHRVAQRTDELTRALAQLQQVDAMKSDFFANVSHELRTPLTLVVVPLEDRLSRSDLPDAERALLQGIRQNARRLLRFIDDLLDLSRIEAGHLRLEVAPLDLPDLVHQVATLFDSTAQARGITLAIDAPQQVPNLHGDRQRLDVVLTNLLANAIKYTPDGGRVTVRVRDLGDEVRVDVEDTGPGIPAEELPAIFQRYYQSSEARRRGTGGVGIGLALARNLTALHGGRLTATSVVDRGSTFSVFLLRGLAHFDDAVLERRQVRAPAHPGRRLDDGFGPSNTPLPAAPMESPVSAGPRMDGGRRPRVLVVEDNDDIRALIERLLAPHCDVTTCNDGAAGLKAARALHPDAVLTDVMMPHLNGIELTRAIKSDPALQGIPVLVLTARQGPESALDAFGHGADDFVEKPFHPRVLLARLFAHLRLRALNVEVVSQSRLAAVGTLAAGVGHEVRNPVNALVNGVRLLKERDDLPPDTRRLLDVLEEGAGRIDRISEALLLHASPGDSGGERPVALRESFESTLALLGHRLQDVAVHTNVEGASRAVASAGAVNQVLLNLVDNALRSGAHTLWLSAQDDGDHVIARVADDGPGVPHALAERIFDPFFTTREPGAGTGLGLSVSRQLAHQCRGELSHAPRPGGGALFSLTLPREHP